MSENQVIRIVLASDQPIYRRGLQHLLQSLKGVQLIGEAHDATETLQLCELVRPDILLLDLKLPLQTGRELVQRVSRIATNMRVIFLLNSQQESEFQGAGETQGPYYFSKDVSEDEFTAALYRIGQQGLRAPAVIENLPLVPDPVAFPPVDTQKSIARELHMAGRVQAGFLPEKTPTIPGFDISARLESARETSGDFYDFIPLANQNWGFVVADVTDKGIGAALFMALSSTLLRTFAVRYPTLPALTMDLVNERILTDTRGSMFVTAFYGVLEPHTGRLRFVNAGHPPACLLSSQKGKPVDLLRPTGMALGMLEKAHWGQKLVRLNPGDVLVLYTDGVTEAQNAQGDFFGEQRLVDLARVKSTCPAQEIQDAIYSEVRRFVGSTDRQDDIALVVIRRTG